MAFQGHDEKLWSQRKSKLKLVKEALPALAQSLIAASSVGKALKSCTSRMRFHFCMKVSQGLVLVAAPHER